MSLKYIFKQDESELRQDPLASGETITEGEFVTRTSDGELARFDPANDALPSGIIVHHVGPLSDALVEHDEDYVAYEDLYTFDAADGDAPYYLPLKAGQTIMPETIKDTNLTEPSISDGTTVGIVTIGSSGETRIVESGYSDSGTTYSEAGTGDFVALGEVYQHRAGQQIIENDYDERIPVMLTPEVFQP
jgi:hypothetical protein